MPKKEINRIDVFAKLVAPKGTFDYKLCEELLGDHYNNFVNFCQAIEIIPEDISKMKVVSFPEHGDDGPAQFCIEFMDGHTITLEK